MLNQIPNKNLDRTLLLQVISITDNMLNSGEWVDEGSMDAINDCIDSAHKGSQSLFSFLGVHVDRLVWSEYDDTYRDAVVYMSQYLSLCSEQEPWSFA